MSELLAVARKLVARGLSVLPVGANKIPASDLLPLVTDPTGRRTRSWKPYQLRQPNQAELAGWFGAASDCGLGIVAGAVSRNLEILDFDSPDVLQPYADLVEERLPGFLKSLPCVETPRGGRHVYYRCEQIDGNRKLATRLEPVEVGDLTEADAGKKGWRRRQSDGQWFALRTLIETRGEGGYVVAPGSPAHCHPTGNLYRQRRGSLSDIPQITTEQRAILIDCARAFDEAWLLEAVADPPTQPGAGEKGRLRPGDDYDARGDLRALLRRHGWTAVRSFGDRELWRRPGKSDGWSASLLNGRLFYVFSSSTSFESQRAYSPFQAYARLEHNGDFQAAARALAREGFGEPGRPSETPDHSDRPSVVAAPTPAQDQEWPAPQPLPAGLRPVPALPDSIIPEALRPWLLDLSDRLQTPLDFPATAAIVALASVIGSQLRIRPKRKDDWVVTPNLWGAIVGRPGSMKSPAIAEALKPLHRLVKEAEQDFEQREREHRLNLEKAEIRRLARREQMKKAAKRGDNLDGFALDDEEIEEPHERRFIVNDATVEKYGELLNQNPNGLLYFRDELTGWLRSLDDERRANDRAFFLEAWNGDGSYAYDRIGRGTLKIANTTTSIFGGIQPSPLAAYLRAALSFGGDDGLLQRFQALVYPDALEDWRNVDRWPETAARNQAFDVFRRLSAIADLNLRTEADDEGRPFLRFSEEAQEFFNEWLTDHMREVKSGAIEHPLLETHLTKSRKLMPALSLIFYLCAPAGDQDIGAVSLIAAEQAAAWWSFLWAHAQRIYGLAIEADALNARALARRLQAGEIAAGFTPRLVCQKGWAGLDRVEAVRDAAETLVSLGWLRDCETRNPAGGRPTVQYLINPRIQEAKL